MYDKLNKLLKDLSKIGFSEESSEIVKLAASPVSLFGPQFDPIGQWTIWVRLQDGEWFDVAMGSPADNPDDELDRLLDDTGSSVEEIVVEVKPLGYDWYTRNRYLRSPSDATEWYAESFPDITGGRIVQPKKIPEELKTDEHLPPDLYEGDFSKEIPIGKDIEQFEDSEETKLSHLISKLKKMGLSKEALEVLKLAAPEDDEFTDPDIKEWHEDPEKESDITTYHNEPRFEWKDRSYPVMKEDSRPFERPEYHPRNFKPSNFSIFTPEEDELPGWQKEREEAGKHKGFGYYKPFPTELAKRRHLGDLYIFLNHMEDRGYDVKELGSKDVEHIRLLAKDYLKPEVQELLEEWFERHGYNNPVETNKRQLDRIYPPDLYEGDFSKEVPIGKDIEQIEESEETTLAHYISNLIKMANDLDKEGRYELADQIEQIIEDSIEKL